MRIGDKTDSSRILESCPQKCGNFCGRAVKVVNKIDLSALTAKCRGVLKVSAVVVAAAIVFSIPKFVPIFSGISITSYTY